MIERKIALVSVLSLGALAAIAALAGACAQDVPGITPPFDQLFFPSGAVCVRGPNTSCDFLAVASSNFDQRYNAAVLQLYSVDKLAAASPTPTSSTAVTFNDTFLDALVDHIRVRQFAGELSFIPGNAQTPDLILQPSRGNNSVSVIAVNSAGGSPKLDCSSAGGDPILGLDCTQPYVFPTHSLDPYSLSYARTASVVAIGHLRGETDPPPATMYTLELNLIDLVQLRTRIARHDANIDPVLRIYEPNIPGVTGLAFSPAQAMGTPNGAFIAAQRVQAAGAPAALTSYDLGFDAMGKVSLNQSEILSLGGLTATSELRGMELSKDGRRAYVSMRFPGIPGTQFQSALGVVDVSEHPFRLLSVYALGEELEHPFVRERMIGGVLQRLVYITDLRRDAIFIVDASRDTPVVAGEIFGRKERTLSNGMVLAHTLDGPDAIAFAEDHGGRSLAFVTNFANDTLAVVDVTDQDPRKHRVIARFGTVIYADNTGETPQ